MTMELATLLDMDLVLTGMEAADSSDAIRRLGDLLFRRGYVDDRFVDAALDRETRFPTGLPTEPIQIALPHAEVEFVHTSKVAIGVLRRPVAFQRMDDPASAVEAKAVFVLAIADAKTQVLALQQLADLFQDGVTLQQVAAAQSAGEALEAMHAGLARLAARSNG